MDGLGLSMGLVFLMISRVVLWLGSDNDLVFVFILAVDPRYIRCSAGWEDDGGWGVGVRGGRTIHV